MNKIMEAADLIERSYDEPPKCGALRCKPCFKFYEISKPHISTLTPLREQRTLSPTLSGTPATAPPNAPPPSPRIKPESSSMEKKRIHASIISAE